MKKKQFCLFNPHFSEAFPEVGWHFGRLAVLLVRLTCAGHGNPVGSNVTQMPPVGSNGSNIVCVYIYIIPLLGNKICISHY